MWKLCSLSWFLCQLLFIYLLTAKHRLLYIRYKKHNLCKIVSHTFLMHSWLSTLLGQGVCGGGHSLLSVVAVRGSACDAVIFLHCTARPPRCDLFYCVTLTDFMGMWLVLQCTKSVVHTTGWLKLKYPTGQNAISRQLCEIFIPNFLDLYGRDSATILIFFLNCFSFLPSYGYVNILCHICNSARNNQQQLVIFIVKKHQVLLQIPKSDK